MQKGWKKNSAQIKEIVEWKTVQLFTRLDETVQLAHHTLCS